MTAGPSHASAELERAVRTHAARIVGRDPAAREDLAPGAEVEPVDLLDRLLASRFEAYELVAHARLGSHHVYKTRLVGPPTFVIQARWVADADGRWRIRQVEVARVEGDRPGAGPPAAAPDA